jgi:hypothetical protein
LIPNYDSLTFESVCFKDIVILLGFAPAGSQNQLPAGFRALKPGTGFIKKPAGYLVFVFSKKFSELGQNYYLKYKKN